MYIFHDEHGIVNNAEVDKTFGILANSPMLNTADCSIFVSLNNIIAFFKQLYKNPRFISTGLEHCISTLKIRVSKWGIH